MYRTHILYPQGIQTTSSFLNCSKPKGACSTNICSLKKKFNKNHPSLESPRITANFER